MPAGRRAIVALLLALGTLAVFLPATGNGFVEVDDSSYVTANPTVQQGLTLSGLRWSLSANVAGNWHPLTLWSHMLDATLFGSNPRGHHLTSVLLHALNAALVFLLFASLTGAAGRSAALAALWAVHPLRVESVAWVAERKDVLSGALFLLAVLAYASWARSRRPALYGFSLLAFAGGLMAKPMVVTLPAVLLLLDAWPLQRLGTSLAAARARVVEKAPFFLLSALGALATLGFQSTALATRTSFSFTGRLANAVIGCAEYVRASLWPASLAALYPLPAVLPWGRLAVAVVLISGVSGLAWRLRRRAPYLAVGWCWLVGMLVPVLGLVQVGAQAWADRYSYLPQLGLALALVWGLAAAVPRLAGRRLGAAMLLAGLALAVLAEVVLVRRQIPVWRDDVALWSHAVAVTPPSYFAEVNLGAGLLRAGRSAEAAGRYRAAAALAPQSLEARAGYGESLRSSGRAEEAIEVLRGAVALAPRDPRPHASLAHALLDAGQRPAALAELRVAVALAPDDAQLADLLRRLEAGGG